MWPVGSCLQVFSGFHYSYVWVELCSTPPQPSAPNCQSYKPPQCRLSRQASFTNFTVCMFYMPSHEMHSFNIHESRKLTRLSMTRDRTGEPRDRGKEEQTEDYLNICLIWGIRLTGIWKICFSPKPLIQSLAFGNMLPLQDKLITRICSSCAALITPTL